jgi:TRADD-N domain-containing protein
MPVACLRASNRRNAKEDKIMTGLPTQTAADLQGVNVESVLTTIRGGDHDIKTTAIAQIDLLTKYYNRVLKQANDSFWWAEATAAAGFLLFGIAVACVIWGEANQALNGATIAGLGGAIVQVISGLQFWLYGKTTDQLAHFHQSLEQTQRFLIASSLCDSLDDKATQLNALSTLIATISGSEPTQHVPTDPMAKPIGNGATAPPAATAAQ